MKKGLILFLTVLMAVSVSFIGCGNAEDGATGPQGPAPTDEQVAAAVAAYLLGGKVSGTTITAGKTATVPAGAKLTIPAGYTLELPAGGTFTVDGTFEISAGAKIVRDPIKDSDDKEVTPAATVKFGTHGENSIASWPTRFTAGTLTVAVTQGAEVFTFTDPVFVAGSRWQIDAGETLNLVGKVTLPSTGKFEIHNENGTLDLSGVTSWEGDGIIAFIKNFTVPDKLVPVSPATYTESGSNWTVTWYQYIVKPTTTPGATN